MNTNSSTINGSTAVHLPSLPSLSLPATAQPTPAPLADKRMPLSVSEAWLPVHTRNPTTPETRRLIAWVDAICPYMSGEEIRALGDPEFPGIERRPIRPRVATAPEIK